MENIAQNMAALRRRIGEASQKAGRDPESVRLIAVSKFKTESDVRVALGAGQRVFGENRVQEAKEKFKVLRADYPDLELHLIGPLQTNKVDDAVRLFDVIETLDRPKLAEALAQAIKKLGRAPRLYVQVNIGTEPQKAGVAVADLKSFLLFCREVCGLTISGLMCIPPQAEDPESYFKQMKLLADQQALPHLSMGMSSDFEKAIACGATHVRVGTALFGERV